MFCHLTRNRCVRRRGLFVAFEQGGTNRRADAIGSRLLQSRNHTHYVAGSVETTERYLACKQRLRGAVNDRIGLEP